MLVVIRHLFLSTIRLVAVALLNNSVFCKDSLHTQGNTTISVFPAVSTCVDNNPCLNGGKCYESRVDKDVIGSELTASELAMSERSSQGRRRVVERYYSVKCACQRGFDGLRCERRELYAELLCSHVISAVLSSS